jgi:hypothetical protein
VLSHVLEFAYRPIAVDLQLESLRPTDRAAGARWAAVAVVTAKCIAVKVSAVGTGAVVAKAVAQPVVGPARWVGSSG